MSAQILRQRYRIIKPLANAGSGDTYLAQDLDLPHTPYCVVKQLKPSSSSLFVIKEAQRLFAQEAQVLSILGEHDRIPRLLAYFEEDGHFYLVQEFIEGHDLSQEFLGGVKWRESEVVDFLTDTLEVLHFVHQKKIIHRDLKPSNIIRRAEDDKLVLIDFGAVKAITGLGTEQAEQTCLTIIIGTPGYMAIEQRGGRPRFNSDIYSLGMIAIRALTGSSLEELSVDEETGEIIWHHQAEVSEELAAIVDKMVRSHFQDRYQSVQEVWQDLRAYRHPIFFTRVITNLTTTKTWLQLEKVKWATIIPMLAVCSMVGASVSLPKLRLFSSTPQTNVAPSHFPLSSSQPVVQKLLQEANNLVALGLHTHALKIYQQALQIDPNHADSHRELCQLLDSLGQDEQALVSCDRAKTIDPNYAEAWSSHCAVLADLGRKDEALSDCRQARILNPASGIVWNDFGSALVKLELYEQALHAYDKALELRPDLYYAWNNQGNLLNRLQHHDQALISYEQAIKLRPQLHYAWHGRAYALKSLHRYQEALAAYEQVLILKPNLEIAMRNRQQLRQKLGS